MGACMSIDNAENKESHKRSKEIDKQLLELAKEEKNVIKILILGTGESGKSTLVKQMKIIHNEGFTVDELLNFKPAVLDNLVTSMKYVLAGMGILRIRLEKPKNKYYAETILQCNCCYDEYFTMLPDVVSSLKNLWNDKGVREAVARGFEFQLNDSALYFFENMNRITSEKYVPNSRDVLRARIRTTGIIETQFKVDHMIFRMVDVGGQRSERRKWIKCFDDVRSLLFVVSLTEYDMALREDPKINRLHESLKLFHDICNNIYFRVVATLLFLNKLDLFREKILYSERHLRDFIKEYQGPDKDVDAAALFIQDLFKKQNEVPNKEIYSHFTTATDTSNVRVVFQLVTETVLRENLTQATLL